MLETDSERGINMFNKKKCFKCDSRNIKTIKEDYSTKMQRNLLNLVMPIRLLLGYAKTPKEQHVCRDCGFTWTEL